MDFFHLKYFDFKDKKVLIRVDFNVPLNEDLEITNDKRIKAALPTIKHILDNGAAVILMSHLGRPKGEGPEDKFKLDPVAKRLSELLGKGVKKLDDCIGENIKSVVSEINAGEIILLENLRFHKEEKKGNEDFAKELASMADLYVNDAFGTCHRAHASVAQITNYLPSAAGYLVEKEIDMIGSVVENPVKPYVAILGGAKISDKIKLVESLLKKVDKLLLGGAMIFTFYKARGLEIGKSLVEESFLDDAKRLLDEAGDKLVLPIDVVVADKFEAEAESKNVLVEEMPADWIGLDIGEASVQLFKTIIDNAKTIVWNGPMGVFEFEKFAKGTEEVARNVANLSSNSDARTVIGGGDSAAAVMKMGLDEKMSHVSTGGGASLEFLQAGTLPALECLKENYLKFKDKL